MSLGKTWNLIGKPLYRLLTFTQERIFQWKNHFFCSWTILVYSHFYPKLTGSNYKNYQSNFCGNPNGVKFKRKLTRINFQFHLARPNPRDKVISTLKRSFQQETSRVSCQARILRSVELTRINLKTCRII